MKFLLNTLSLLLFIILFTSCKNDKPNATVEFDPKPTVTPTANPVEQAPKQYSEFLTLGDNKEKVIRLLGEPVSIQSDAESKRDALTFEEGTILLMDGKVHGWNNQSKNLPVKFETNAKKASTNNFITMGSSVWDALQIYGTPKSLLIQDSSNSHLTYGTSKLLYVDGKLDSYYNEKGRFDIRFDFKNTGDQTFSVGSTTNQVLSSQGIPTRITNLAKYSMWKYGRSFVMFDKGGTVTKFQNTGANLNVSTQ